MLAVECLVEGNTTSATEVSGGYLPLAFVCLPLGEIKIREFSSTLKTFLFFLI